MTAEEISNLVEREIERIGEPELVHRIRELLVVPYPVERDWNYGAPGQKFTCWTVVEHQESNTGIAYCEDGFGPSYLWGLMFLSGSHMDMGMDCNWYASLEDAMRESMAWEQPNPPGYEVQ